MTAPWLMRAPHPRGFTLLEVMLAVTIFGIVALAIYGTFARTLSAKQIVEERADVTRLGRSALARMTEEIGAAFYPESVAAGGNRQGGAIFRSLTGGTEDAPLDALIFSSLSSRPSGSTSHDSDQRVIAYFFHDPSEIRDKGERSGRSRDRRAPTLPADVEDFFAAFGPVRSPAPGTTPERLLRREALMIGGDQDLVPQIATVFLDNVASLSFRFHDGNDWYDAWDSEDRATYYRRLPRAVEIDLGLYDSDGAIHHFATAVDLPLSDPRPNAARSSPGVRSTPAPRGSAS